MGYFSLLTAVSILFCASFSSAQAPVPTPTRKPPDSKTLHITPQKMFAPYWTIEPGWHSEIQLRNNLISSPLTVTPVLTGGCNISVAELP